MNRQDLQNLAEAYANVQEGTMDIKGFEIPKEEQKAAAKRVKEKTAAKKNIRGNDSAEQKARLEKKRGMKLDDHPQFKKEEVSGITAAYQAVYDKEEVVDEAAPLIAVPVVAAKGAAKVGAKMVAKKVAKKVADKAKDKAKKVGKGALAGAIEGAKKGMKEEVIDEADSLAAMAARREKRLQAQRKKMGTTATGQDFGHDYGISSDERKKRQKAEFDAFVGRGKKKTNEEVEAVDEGLTGARADRARQMQDSDTKSKGGKRTLADRDTAFRLGTGTAEKGARKVGGRGGDEYGDRGRGNAAKRRMKMEELEATGKFSAEEIEAILALEHHEKDENGKVIEHDIEVDEAAPVGAALGNIVGRTIGGKIGGAAGAEVGKYAGAAGGAAALAKKGQKGKKAAGAALGSVVPGMGVGLGSAAGAALVNSHEMEGNPIYEATKGDIEQYALDEIMGALGKLASQGAKAVKDVGAMAGETGSKIAQGAVDAGKSVVKFAKEKPLAATAIGAGTAGAGALAIDKMKKK